MALCVGSFKVILREIKLAQKPPEFIRVSAKSTVPVLVLEDGRVLDESLDIMLWALRQHDPQEWLDTDSPLTQQLIAENDGSFKSHLDHYKYFDRYPECTQLVYRQKGELFLQKLEVFLEQQDYLLSDGRPTLVDVAVMPFVRQFAGVEPNWFETSPYVRLREWLKTFIQSDLFKIVMTRYPFWNAGEKEVLFPR